MADEFDDMVEPALWHRAGRIAEQTDGRHAVPAARLVSRLYGAAKQPLRARLLECLLKPLGPLSLVAVAAGAFGGFLHRGGVKTTMDDVARYSNEQMAELARFVEQVSPEALQEFAWLIADNPVGMAAFSTSVALLLVRTLRRKGEPQPRAIAHE